MGVVDLIDEVNGNVGGHVVEGFVNPSKHGKAKIRDSVRVFFNPTSVGLQSEVETRSCNEEHFLAQSTLLSRRAERRASVANALLRVLDDRLGHCSHSGVVLHHQAEVSAHLRARGRSPQCEVPALNACSSGAGTIEVPNKSMAYQSRCAPSRARGNKHR